MQTYRSIQVLFKGEDDSSLEMESIIFIKGYVYIIGKLQS